MKRDLYKVRERPDLRKDMRTGAILLSDSKSSDEYASRKKMMNDSRYMNEDINSLKEKIKSIDALRDDVQQIKELLQRILNK
jgi:hypothetical protein